MYFTLDHASLNTARLRTGLMTAGIFAAMVAVLYFCSSLVIGDDGLLVAAALGVFLLALTANPPAGLVMRLSGAVPIPPRDARDLHAAVSELSRRAGLAVTPTLWWLPSPGINAFAAGHPDGAAIAVSDGAFRALSRHELVSVLAHEVAHVAAGDTRLMMIGSVPFRITQVFAMLGLIAATALLFLTGDAGGGPALPRAVAQQRVRRRPDRRSASRRCRRLGARPGAPRAPPAGRRHPAPPAANPPGHGRASEPAPRERSAHIAEPDVSLLLTSFQQSPPYPHPAQVGSAHRHRRVYGLQRDPRTFLVFLIWIQFL